MRQEYDPRAIEAAAQAYWEQAQSFKAVEDPSREKFYCLCHVALSVRRSCTWAMCATTLSAMWSLPAISGCSARTCCSRWASMPSACRPRMLPSSAADPAGPEWTNVQHGEHEGASCKSARALPMTGTRELATCKPGVLPARSSGFFGRAHTPRGWCIAPRIRWSTGIRLTRPCSPTSRWWMARAGARVCRSRRREIRAVVLPHHRLRRRIARTIWTSLSGWPDSGTRPCSATGSVAPKVWKSISRIEGSKAIQLTASTPRARTL
jgi:hypothetical protein